MWYVGEKPMRDMAFERPFLSSSFGIQTRSGPRLVPDVITEGRS